MSAKYPLPGTAGLLLSAEGVGADDADEDYQGGTVIDLEANLEDAASRLPPAITVELISHIHGSTSPGGVSDAVEVQGYFTNVDPTVEFPETPTAYVSEFMENHLGTIQNDAPDDTTVAGTIRRACSVRLPVRARYLVLWYNIATLSAADSIALEVRAQFVD